MTLAGGGDLLVVGQLGEALQQFATEGDLLEIGIGHLVFCLHPGGSLSTRVVLQPAVGVGHFCAEILVDGAVFSGLGVLQPLCRDCSGS